MKHLLVQRGRYCLAILMVAWLTGCGESPPPTDTPSPSPQAATPTPPFDEFKELERSKGTSFIEWQHNQGQVPVEPPPVPQLASTTERHDRMDLGHDKPAWQRDIEAKLARPIEFNFAGESFPTVLDYLSNKAGVPIHYDIKALKNYPPVELDVSGLTVGQALKLVLQTNGEGLVLELRDSAIYLNETANFGRQNSNVAQVPIP